MNSIEKLNSNCFADIESFINECYLLYQKAWYTKPLFNKKPIYRTTDLIRNKEKSFWGLVDGHNDNVKYNDLRRYETIPFFTYIITTIQYSNNTESDDIIWFEFDRKINVLSKKYNYFVVLKETSNSIILITGYPITDNKTIQKIKQWRDCNKNV